LVPGAPTALIKLVPATVCVYVQTHLVAIDRAKLLKSVALFCVKLFLALNHVRFDADALWNDNRMWMVTDPLWNNEAVTFGRRT
jgi:hypothetical protein